MRGFSFDIFRCHQHSVLKVFLENQKPTSIVFFNGHHVWGGGEKWHLDMARLIGKDGYPVRIVAAPRSELSQRARQAGVPLIEIPVGNLSFLNPIKLYKLYRLFRKVSVQSIILNLPSDLKAAGLAARLAGVPRIIYRRGSAIPIRNTWFNRFIFKYIVTDIIANSQETKRTVVAKNPLIFPVEKIHVLYNGIHLEKYD
jgi:hypothetical protein